MHRSSYEVLKLENLSLYVADVFFAVLVRLYMHNSYFSIKLQKQEVLNTESVMSGAPPYHALHTLCTFSFTVEYLLLYKT
jgi:hypothetical protein